MTADEQRARELIARGLEEVARAIRSGLMPAAHLGDIGAWVARTLMQVKEIAEFVTALEAVFGKDGVR